MHSDLEPCAVHQVRPSLSRPVWRLRLMGGCGHRRRTTPRRASKTIQRMDNVLIVVDDLDAVVAFFVELGTELESKGPSRDVGWSV